MLLGENGIFEKSKWAKFENAIAQKEEAERVIYLNNYMEKYASKNKIASTQETMPIKVIDKEMWAVKGDQLNNDNLEESLKEAIQIAEEIAIENITSEETKVQLYEIDNQEINIEDNEVHVINIVSGKVYKLNAFRYKGKKYHRPETKQYKEESKVKNDDGYKKIYQYNLLKNNIENKICVNSVNDNKNGKIIKFSKNVILNQNKDGIYLTGDSDSYGQTNDGILDLSFPLTISYIIKPEEISGFGFVLADGTTDVCMTLYNNGDNVEIACSGSDSEVYIIPKSELYDGNIKYITVTYEETVTNHQLYIDGEKIEKASKTDYYNLPNTTYTSIGCRYYKSLKDFYKGYIYKISSYNKKLNDDEINQLFINDKNYLENGSAKVNYMDNNLKAEYNIKENNSVPKTVITSIRDNIKNKVVDFTGNIELSADKKGLYFTGESENYGQTNDGILDLSFPLTISYIIKPEEISGFGFVLADGVTDVCMTLYNNGDNVEIACSGLNSEVYIIPKSELYDGNIKYITVTYEENVKNHQLYIDGEKIEKSSTEDYYRIGNTTYTVIGCRVYSNFNSFYKGTIYSITTYNSKLSDEDIRNIYDFDKSVFK